MEGTGVLFTSVFSEFNDEVITPQRVEAEAIFVPIGEEVIVKRFRLIFTSSFLDNV